MTLKSKRNSNALMEMGAGMGRARSLGRAGRSVLLAMCVAVGCEKEAPYVEVSPEVLRAVRAFSPQTERGQSATLLPSGDWLLLGGEENGLPVAAAKLLENGRELPIGEMHYARSGHTATVLPDGSVLVLGGVGLDGRVVKTAESFNVGTRQFVKLEGLESLARAEHTATLLSDGRLLIVGGQNGAEPLASVLLWNSVTRETERPGIHLERSRKQHSAILLPSGLALVTGGVDAADKAVSEGEVFNPKTNRVVRFDAQQRAALSTQLLEQRAPSAEEVVLAAVTANQDYFPCVRFSKPMEPRTLTSKTVTLLGPDGALLASPVVAERGMLLFLRPATKLTPGTDYDIFIKGAADEQGRELPFVALHFRTPSISPSKAVARSDLPRASSWRRAASAVPASTLSRPPAVRWMNELKWKADGRSGDEELWIPKAEHFRGKWWNKLPPVDGAVAPEAPMGVTALAGRVLKLDGSPLANVTLRMQGKETTTNANGFFLLSYLSPGFARLDIDGRTANRRDVFYGTYAVRVEVKPKVTTQLPYIIWMPRLDPQGTVTIPSPTTEETVVSSPSIPGLELHIPPNVVIRDRDGNVVTELNLTAIPVNQPPFPLPSLGVPVYFTIQPGGAVIHSLTPEVTGARLFYPNFQREVPGAKGAFWNYDANSRGWFIYGLGTISPDGWQAIPDPGVVITELSGAMFSGPPPSDPDGPDDPDDPGGGCDKKNAGVGCPGSGKAGEPVSLLTGQFSYAEADFALPDVLPLVVSRTYRSLDKNRRMFGVGLTLDYDLFFWSAQMYQVVDLILPDGKRVHYTRFSPGEGWADAKFISKNKGRWYASRVEWNAERTGWDLFFKDGSKWFFPDNAPIQEMVDRFGNKLFFTRANKNAPISRIDSPNGRWVEFTLDPDVGVVTQARDSGGRTFRYEYDANWQLRTVTNANGDAHTFEWNDDNRLTKVHSARGPTVLENTYGPNLGRVDRQVLGDGRTFTFNWGPEPFRGFVALTGGSSRKVGHRNGSGGAGAAVLTESWRNPGTPQEQYTSFEYEEDAFLPKKVTDHIGRKTAFSYDAMGNVTSVTRLAETPDAVTTNYTYSSDFNRLTSFTDPLQHRTSFNYDNRGNLTEVKDALNHSVTFEHDSQGRVTKITDALNHSVTFTYLGPDLVTITDALGHSYQMTYDGIGRLRAVDDPAGNRTRYNYDLMGRLKEIVDAAGKNVLFDYDPDGNMIASTDQRGKTTRYESDVLNRLSSRTDPLGKQETFTYANNGKLEKVTDRKGQISLRRYDVLDRLWWIGIGATVPAPDVYESTIELHYDGANRLTSLVDSANGTISYEYDGLDRLKKETSSLGVVQYDYDAADRLTLTTPPGQAPIEYAFDNGNRLQEIRSAGDVVHFTVDNANRPTTLQLRNGLVVDYNYDDGNQLKSIAYSNAAGPVGDLTYDYDALGRVTHLGGSLASLNFPASVTGAIYNDHNQLTMFNGASYVYDENGNLTSDGTRSFTWNGRDELIQISGASTSAQFSYDAIGRRTRKSVNSAATKYLYDGPNILQERNDDSSIRASFLPGFEYDQVFGRTKGSNKSEYITNPLGSTLALADASGNLVTSYTYEPYGKVTQNGAADDNSRTFTGREDDGNGLLYYRARYYDPVGGRFITEDPIGLKGGMNLYTYVYDDPINFADPDGHGAKSWAKAVFLAMRLWLTQHAESMQRLPQELDEMEQVVKRNAKQRRRGNPRPSGACPPGGPEPNGLDLEDWIDMLVPVPLFFDPRLVDPSIGRSQNPRDMIL